MLLEMAPDLFPHFPEFSIVYYLFYSCGPYVRFVISIAPPSHRQISVGGLLRNRTPNSCPKYRGACPKFNAQIPTRNSGRPARILARILCPNTRPKFCSKFCPKLLPPMFLTRKSQFLTFGWPKPLQGVEGSAPKCRSFAAPQVRKSWF